MALQIIVSSIVPSRMPPYGNAAQPKFRHDDCAAILYPDRKAVRRQSMISSNPSQLATAGSKSASELAFLHIGKNAGTQIMFLAQQLKPHGVTVHQLPHDAKLCRLPEKLPYFFSIRNPISRFKSGFYSRKRKGQPRLYVEWSKHEAFAFQNFEHANDLAEALFRTDALGRMATQAIQSIRHTSMQQIDWFERVAVLDLRPPVWIIRQEKLEEDFNTLLGRMGLPITCGDLKLATDSMAAHANDYGTAPDLSPGARDNLSRWYARDFVFYDLCVDWMARQGGRP
ncbi:MAG: hypothetical protein WBX21_16890 [Aestuariivirga sp.]